MIRCHFSTQRAFPLIIETTLDTNLLKLVFFLRLGLYLETKKLTLQKEWPQDRTVGDRNTPRQTAQMKFSSAFGKNGMAKQILMKVLFLLL